MLKRRPRSDYEAVTRTRRQPASGTSAAVRGMASSHNYLTHDDEAMPPGNLFSTQKPTATFLKPAHKLSFAALFLFTVVLYARPSEFYPSPVTASIALIIGVITLGIFAVSQLSLERTLTTPVREVKLVLLFALTGLPSIPIAMNPSVAWH